MVITETGASSAVVKLLPELEGKLTGNAIRVPTPNVSLAILNLTLEKAGSEEEVREFLRSAASAQQSSAPDRLHYLARDCIVGPSW